MDVTHNQYRSERSYQAEGVIQYSTSTTGDSCEVQTWVDLTVIVIVIVFSILDSCVVALLSLLIPLSDLDASVKLWVERDDEKKDGE